MLLLLASLLLAENGPYGHVTSSLSSVRFSADSVLGTFADLEFAGGHWRGTLGRGRVDWTLKQQLYNGDPSFVLDGPDVEVVYVHHQAIWYARGWLRGTEVTVIWPDDLAVSGWNDFQFDGIAAQPNPPFVPLVIAVYASEVNKDGVFDKKRSRVQLLPSRAR